MPSPDGLFLGVDGGGTKTCFVLIKDGVEVARHVEPSGYHLQVGLDGLAATLTAGVAAVLATARSGADDVAHAFFGLPAYGEDSRVTAQLDAMPGAVLGHHRFTVGNDMVCGWAGSLACQDGISITAGTGSIGYGERQGRAARSGGWGELFSDEGSAYWVAVRGLNLFSRMSDGRRPKGPLHAILRDRFQLADDLDLSGFVLSDLAASRDKVAALSATVSEAAAAGDARAAAIFAQAAGELAEIAEAIRVPLGFTGDETVPLSYSGGVFRAGALVLEPFEAALKAAYAGYRLQEPQYDPGFGAALYAQKQATGSSRN